MGIMTLLQAQEVIQKLVLTLRIEERSEKTEINKIVCFSHY